MITSHSEASNVLEVTATESCVIWFRRSLYPGADADQPYLPPCPMGSPVGRLWHGAYWLRRRRLLPGQRARLIGPMATGRFILRQVSLGEAIFVNAGFLAGYVAGGKEAGFRTLVSQIVDPAAWAIGHPLPMVFHGPGTVMLYGDNLLEVTPETPAWERPSSMLASFDASHAFLAVAGRPTSPDLAMWANITTCETFQCLERHTWVVVSEVYRPRSGSGLIPNELLIHLSALALLWLISRA